MTAQQKRTLASTLTVVAGALIIPVMTWAWSTKVDTNTFNIHVVTADARWKADSVERANQTKMLMSVLCTIKPEDTQCDREKRPK